MKTLKIFEHDIGKSSFEVWATDGLLQFVIDGQIRHDIDTVEDFLSAAGAAINRPNDTDDLIVESSGAISQRAVENFEQGSVALDANGTNPGISLQDEGTEVKISGAGVGGSFRIDFGTGSGAEAEAAQFLAFADDLLGQPATTEIGQITDVQIGDFLRTVSVSTRDDDIQEVKFKSTRDDRDKTWADAYIDDLAKQFGGSQSRDGNVSESGYTALQIRATGDDGKSVDLGSNGVGGKEVWDFAAAEDAQGFIEAVKEDFGAGGDARAIINDAIESLAFDLGGQQVRDGNVAEDYEARQIRLTGADKDMVHLGGHKVGGREIYQFADQESAQAFIDKVRDMVGVEASDGKIVDEFVYQVSGGAGISGSPSFVGKDAFVAFIADEFDGHQIRNGSVSESFSGGGRLIGDGSGVQLGPQGVGGREIWQFEDAATAQAFIDALDQIF